MVRILPLVPLTILLAAATCFAQRGGYDPAERLKAMDTNNDGKLEKEEIPERFRSFMMRRFEDAGLDTSKPVDIKSYLEARERDDDDDRRRDDDDDRRRGWSRDRDRDSDDRRDRDDEDQRLVPGFGESVDLPEVPGFGGDSTTAGPQCGHKAYRWRIDITSGLSVTSKAFCAATIATEIGFSIATNGAAGVGVIRGRRNPTRTMTVD